MKAKLQHYYISGYVDIGTIRFNDKKEYSVTPILIENRNGINEISAYKVKCVCTVKDLDPYFSLSSDEHQFQLISLEDISKTLSIGTRKYSISFDNAISKVSVKYCTITIEFIIPVSSYGSYTTFV